MTNCLTLFEGNTQAAYHALTQKQLVVFSCESGLTKLAIWAVRRRSDITCKPISFFFFLFNRTTAVAGHKKSGVIAGGFRQ